jgi:Transposase DDE domain
VLRPECAWRHLPHDFTVNRSAAHKHFLRWWRAGIWPKVLTAIRGEVRTRSGRRRRPTAAVVDSSSLKATPVAGPRGFHSANKVDGVKRHLIVDSGGILVAAVVTEANVQDRAAFGQTATPGQAHRANHHPRLGGQRLHRLHRCRHRRQSRRHH